MIEVLHLFPILLTSIGIVIHLFGVLIHSQHDGPLWLHPIMLVADTLVVAGLSRKTTWGYGLAVALYVEQSIMQTYWGLLAYLGDGGIYQLVVVSTLCIASLMILVFKRRIFIK